MAQSKITFTLNRLVGSLNRAADRLLRQNYGMTYSQFLFVVSLRDSGAVSSGVLADRLGVSAAAVSKRTQWFVERGLVVAKPLATDARSVSLALTETGRALADDTSQFLEKQFRATFRGISSVDLDELNRTLLLVEAYLTSSSSSNREAA